MKAVINRIIPFSSVDGPGNRTAIFLQGCNINCKYCHNPETRKMCVQCGTCVKNCPAGALSFDADGKVAFDPAKCVQCDTCIHVCPNDSSPRTCEMTPEEVEEYAALIDKNGRLLMLLISDILDLSKIESNTMEFNIYTFSLNAMFADIARMQQMNMKSGVELIVDLPEEDTEITADSARLGQVVNNLINNAVKFTPVGSIRIGYRRTGEDMVELFVEDTGNGMSEEVLEHIFERFYKGDSFVQGTGLGLAICKTIVEHFYGEICVRSKPGEGARFDVRLPIGGR